MSTTFAISDRGRGVASHLSHAVISKVDTLTGSSPNSHHLRDNLDLYPSSWISGFAADFSSVSQLLFAFQTIHHQSRKSKSPD